jgi:hypothetical protein
MMTISDFTRNYYSEVAAVAQSIDQTAVDRMIDILVDTRARGGRLFILGVGGGDPLVRARAHGGSAGPALKKVVHWSP